MSGEREAFEALKKARKAELVNEYKALYRGIASRAKLASAEESFLIEKLIELQAIIERLTGETMKPLWPL